MYSSEKAFTLWGGGSEHLSPSSQKINKNKRVKQVASEIICLISIFPSIFQNLLISSLCLPGPSTHFCAIFLIPNEKIFPDGPVFQDEIFFKFLNTISGKAGLEMPVQKIWGPEPEFVSLFIVPSLAESIPWNRFLGSLNG
jgi:hypothetical protein